MRCEPSLRSDIARTTGVRMYAMRNAKMNGSRTLRPRNTMTSTNSGKPHRVRNLRAGVFSPNHVSRRDRAPLLIGPTPPETGGAPLLIGPAPADGGGSSGVIAEPVYHRTRLRRVV